MFFMMNKTCMSCSNAVCDELGVFMHTMARF